MEEGKNGFVFACGEVEALAEKIRWVYALSKEERAAMGRKSVEVVEGYGYGGIIQGLQSI